MSISSIIRYYISRLFGYEPITVAETVTIAKAKAAEASMSFEDLKVAAYYLAEADGFKCDPDVYWNKAVRQLP